jgi:hypothetical protein
MDALIDFLKQPFAWGLALGLLFFCLSFWAHFKTKRELRRYKKLLSDKLELEARQYEVIRKEKESVTKENEHLRVRVQQLMEKPDQKISRDLEELTAEDSGKSLPKRLFNRLFGNSAPRELDARMLPEQAASAGIPVDAAVGIDSVLDPTKATIN